VVYGTTEHRVDIPCSRQDERHIGGCPRQIVQCSSSHLTRWSARIVGGTALLTRRDHR
jgi:hypothetical protein